MKLQIPLLDYLPVISRWSKTAWKSYLKLPIPIQASILGLVLALLNLGLAWRGLATGQLYRHFILVGLLDGLMVSVIAVSFASDKFQAMITGFLGGVGIDNIASQQTLAKRAANAVAETIHSAVEGMPTQLSIPGVDKSEVHHVLDTAVIYAVSAGLFVVLLSLVGNWAIHSVRAVGRTSASRSRNGTNDGRKLP